MGGKVRARENLGRAIHPPVPPCKHASGKRPSILQKVFLCADVFLCNLISNLDQISNLEQLKNIPDVCFWLSRLTVVCINVINPSQNEVKTGLYFLWLINVSLKQFHKVLSFIKTCVPFISLPLHTELY